MEWLQYPLVGLFTVLVATMFLIGELLVKTKGIFAVIGLGLITFYFSYHLTNWTILTVSLLFLIGIILIVIDGKITNDGSLAFIGFVMMVVAVTLPAPTFVYGLYAGLGLLIGILSSLSFIKVFPSREMWTKITLSEKLTTEQGFNSINETYRSLINEQGEAITDFRPSGTIRIGQNEYSAISNGKWINKGTKVKILQVDGTKILVTSVKDGESR